MSWRYFFLYVFLAEAELISADAELTVSECRINQMQTVTTKKALVCQKTREALRSRLNEGKERMRKSSVAEGKCEM